MSTALLNRTTGSILGPDGAPALRPTTILSADAAAILRAYFCWLIKNQLEPELVCATCFNGTRESKAQYQVNEQQIVIICQCHIRFFEGASLPPDPVGESLTTITNDGIGQILLSEGAARLLRLYKRVLVELGLKEMLRCNACYGLDQEDGCEASVTAQSIRIRCRCSNRTYRGMTV